MPWIPRARTLVGQVLGTTWQVEPQVERTLAEIPRGARICDLGAGGRRVRPDALTVDVVAGPEIDIVADVHALPLPSGEFSLVLCTGTLNLCRDPSRVLAEAHRISKVGGLLHLEVGFFQPYTPEPEDYWRFTAAGLRRIAADAGFVEVRSGVHIGPMTALAASSMYIAGKVFEGSGLAHRMLRGAAHGVFGPLKYLDAIVPERARDAAPFAYGIYYVGRKT